MPILERARKVLQERGVTSDSDDKHPLKHSEMETDYPGQTNMMMKSDWDGDVNTNSWDGEIPAGHSVQGQTVKKTVTHTEVRTVRTVNGQVIEDQVDTSHSPEETQHFTYSFSGKDEPYDYDNTERSYSQGGYDGEEYPRRIMTVESPAHNGVHSLGNEYRTGRTSAGSSVSGSVHSEQRGPVSLSQPKGSKTSSSSLPRSSGSKPPQSNVTYNLSMKIGDVRGPGTDGNVYIQLFGDQSNTAKIQLRQAGDTRSKFERGRTYKFTVDTVDIGNVERIKLSHDHRGYGSGFFVDEVEVEIPSRQDRINFPCQCWLAQDAEDARMESEMFVTQQSRAPVPSETIPYTVALKLGDVYKADATLFIQLFGSNGQTSKIMLKPTGTPFNQFDRGKTYKFTVETVDVGDIDRLHVGQDGKGFGNGLYIEQIEISTPNRDPTVFPCQCWLAEDADDGKIERDVYPGLPIPQRENTSYNLHIQTGDVQNAGTDANVFFQLFGEEGQTEKIQLRGGTGRRFERGRTNKFMVETADVGRLTSLKIGHDGAGVASDWFLEDVAINIPTMEEHYYFPVHSWVGNSESASPEVDLSPGPPPPESSSDQSTKYVTEKTTIYKQYNLDGSTSGYPSPRRAGEAPPPVQREPLLQREPQRDSPILREPVEREPLQREPPRRPMVEDEIHVEKRQVVESGVDDLAPLRDYDRDYRETRTTTTTRKDYTSTDYPGRYPDREYPDGDYPDRGAPPVEEEFKVQDKQDVVGGASPWDISGIPIGPASPRSPEVPVADFDDTGIDDSRINGVRLDRSVDPDGKVVDDPAKIVVYQLCMKMGDVLGSGTEGNVYIQLKGDKAVTDKIQLRQSGDSRIKFEKGRTYKFTVETVDIGKIENVRVGHDGYGYGRGWFLEEVTVDVPSREEHVVFPTRCWMAEEKTDGLLEREFHVVPCTYYMTLRTGDQQDAGTNGNVTVQVFGDKGDTGKIQLRQSKEQFGKGRVDYFTLQSNDIGKIDRMHISHDGHGQAGAWFLEELTFSSPQRGEHLIFTCDKWIEESKVDGTKAEMDLFPLDSVTYQTSIVTGDIEGAGTDANVYMQIYGDKGDTGIIDLNQVTDTKGKLDRGKTCKLSLKSIDVGNLTKIRVGHDGHGKGGGSWFLEEFIVIKRDECWIFPCKKWLSDAEGDGKTERILFAEGKTYAHEPDLQDLIEYLQSDNAVLIINAAAYLQHLCYNDENIKAKIRELGGIAILVRLLDHEVFEVYRAALGCLRNLSFYRHSDENQVAIADAGGIQALLRLVKRQDEKIEVKEMATAILWNLSSCEELKKEILVQCLSVLVIWIVIPQSGWSKEVAKNKKAGDVVRWNTLFRNASGILRNISSAGADARQAMRECDGLVECLLWMVYAAIGRNEVDNKSVENAIAIIRNLSYRLETEVDRQKYKDADIEVKQPDTYGGDDNPGCLAGCGGKSKKKEPLKDPKTKEKAGAAYTYKNTETPEGMALLWQPDVIKPYLSLLAESSNPDTLEASSGAIQNLTACFWKWSVLLRYTVRSEKGLPILVELLRMDSDPVVRTVSTALRNLAIDKKNKELIGNYAMVDLVKRLPGSQGGNEGITEPTTGAVICCIHQVVNRNLDGAKKLRDAKGIPKLVAIANSSNEYSPKIVKTANLCLISLWNFRDMRGEIKKNGWEYTNEIANEYGQAGATPKPYEDVSLPRSAKNKPPAANTTDQQPRWEEDHNKNNQPGYLNKGDQRDSNERLQPEEVEMDDLAPGYMGIDDQDDRSHSDHDQAPPAYDSEPIPEHQYSTVDKSKKKKNRPNDDNVLRLSDDGGGGEAKPNDSWV